MRRRARHVLSSCLLALAFWVAHTPGVLAEESRGEDLWRYDAAIYLWAVGFEATTERGNSIDIGFDDVFDNLNLAFMGALWASKDRWSIGIDLMFVDVSAEKAGTLGSTAIDLNANVDMTTWVLNLQGARNLVQAERGSLDVLLGARFLDSTTRLTLRTSVLPITPSLKAKVSAWDLVIGARGDLNITDKWYLPYSVDVGAGQSELTWQALGGIGYRFKWGTLLLAYRHNEWTFRSDEEFKDLTLTGPAIGAVFSF